MLLEHQIDARQQAPEAMCPLRLVRRMHRVLRKWDRVVDLRWHGRDRWVDVQHAEPADQLLIKVRDRPSPQRDPLDPSVVQGDDDLMVDQVDVDGETRPAAPDR